MQLKTTSAVVFLFGFLAISEPVLAHTDINSDAGILSNVIAVGLVVTSIVIFLLVNRKKQKKKNDL